MAPTILAAVALLFPALVQDAPPAGHDGPPWRGPRRDGVWREEGIVERFEGPVLRRRWSVLVEGGSSGPTVAAGRVSLTDRPRGRSVERVLCFDAGTGALLWEHSYHCVYEGFSYDVGPRASVTVYGGRA
jgi:hypothetical protein